VATGPARPRGVPDKPGVYRFFDADDRVIYVGKAKSLTSRISSYFSDPGSLHPRTRSLMEAARHVDWTVVGSEIEALQLEYAWIKEFDPRFNVRYRDDKSYPYLAVTLGEEFPRALVTRGAKRPGSRYFGPYAHAWAIRGTLDALLRVFPVRTCSRGVFERAQRANRPCLLADIGKCAAPCVGRVSPEEHRRLAEDLCSFLGGKARDFQRGLATEMEAASQAQDYERAARLRDDLHALERALERNSVVFDESVDADVVGMALDDLEAAFEVFHVRAGRIRGQRSYVVERVDDSDEADLVGRLLMTLAEETGEHPREVLVPVDPREDIPEWLAWKAGHRVRVRIPHRGAKRDLLLTAGANAEQRLALHKARRSGDLTARSTALREIQEVLALPQAPLRIEAIDVSHLSGTGVVGAVVVFEDGAPRPGEYRTFAISQEGARDDTSAMHEIVARRFRPRANGESEESRRRAFAYSPNLLVIDGGSPQVDAAMRALHELGIHDVAVMGLAKRLEEVWLPGRGDPVILPRGSQGLYLLQRIRDEAHRFALRYQRRTRRRQTRSALQDVPGLGAGRAKALLRAFGSVAAVRRASQEELEAVAGIGPGLARRVVETLHGDTGSGGTSAEPPGEMLASEVNPWQG
jgi:excinuclease ABC subunit C